MEWRKRERERGGTKDSKGNKEKERATTVTEARCGSGKHVGN